MTARELSQLRLLPREIEQDRRRLCELEALATGRVSRICELPFRREDVYKRQEESGPSEALVIAILGAVLCVLAVSTVLLSQRYQRAKRRARRRR